MPGSPGVGILPSVSDPLEAVYLRSGQPLPQMQTIGCLRIPQPFRDLLVHENDMTPTLEAFHGRKISLQVLDRYRQEGCLLRQVVLRLEGEETPVEFGAIRIHLTLFKTQAVQIILEGRVPLGTILREENILHTSGHKEFFSVFSDAVVNQALRLTGAHQLFGRRNVIRDSRGRPLAEMTEILSAVTGSSTRCT